MDVLESVFPEQWEKILGTTSRKRTHKIDKF